MQNKLAHTAEHAFIGSLQKLIGKTLNVVNDLAACVMDHATNLRECVLFLVTRMNKIGSNYEINFVVSDAAKNTAVDLSQKILNICAETELFNTLKNLK
jgi:hypothetical protein